MVWKSKSPQGLEAQKVAHEVFQYMKGQVLDLGCGERKIFPGRGVVGVDNGKEAKLFGLKVNPDIVADVSKLELFADRSIDCVFSSHTLEHFDDYKAVLAEWWRVIKPGGYLVLYLPHPHWYPSRGMPWVNIDHKHEFLPEDITLAMREVAWRSGRGWEQLRNEVRSQDDEFSFLQVYQKKETVTCQEYVAPPKPKKSLGIFRLGAFGDALWISAILPHFKPEYDEIVVYTARQGATVLRHDPHIDRIVEMPEFLLGWDEDENARRGFKSIGELLSGLVQKLEQKHDRFLNLIGSVEGSLLPHPTHPNYWLPESTRRAVMGNQNYLETIHRAARVPYDPRTSAVRFYPTEEERQWAIAERARHAGPFVVINPTGSSLPKHWPHSQRAMELFSEHGVSGVIVGDLREGQKKYNPPAGWSVLGTTVDIRKVFALAALADVVIGTESAVINSVSHEAPLKMVILSHSTTTNLTRDWRTTIAIEPAELRCYPCHRIHADWRHCMFHQDTGAAVCQGIATAEIIVDYAMQWLRGEIGAEDLSQEVLAEVV